MKEDYSKELRNISRVSTVLVAMLCIGIITTAISLIMGLMTLSGMWENAGLGLNLGVVTTNLTASQLMQMTFYNKLAIGLVFVLVMGISLVFLVYAIRLMNCFRKQMIFTDYSIHQAKLIAWISTGSILLSYFSIFVFPRFIYVPTMNIYFTPGPIIFIFILWMFVWVLQIGRALEFDSEMTI